MRTLNLAMLLVVVHWDVGEKACGVVVDADGPVGRFDVHGASGVGDPDVDALSGHDQGAAAGHAMSPG